MRSKSIFHFTDNRFGSKNDFFIHTPLRFDVKTNIFTAIDLPSTAIGGHNDNYSLCNFSYLTTKEFYVLLGLTFVALVTLKLAFIFLNGVYKCNTV